MRKEENTEKDELYGKLQVHFIENVEAEEASTKGYRGGIGQIKREKVRDPIR